MVTIEIIIRDETGAVMQQESKELEIRGERFEHIEQAVEQWKQRTLPEIESVLLKKTEGTVSSEGAMGQERATKSVDTNAAWEV